MSWENAKHAKTAERRSPTRLGGDESKHAGSETGAPILSHCQPFRGSQPMVIPPALKPVLLSNRGHVPVAMIASSSIKVNARPRFAAPEFMVSASRTGLKPKFVQHYFAFSTTSSSMSVKARFREAGFRDFIFTFRWCCRGNTTIRFGRAPAFFLPRP
jgi:hypothetical protein